MGWTLLENVHVRALRGAVHDPRHARHASADDEDVTVDRLDDETLVYRFRNELKRVLGVLHGRRAGGRCRFFLRNRRNRAGQASEPCGHARRQCPLHKRTPGHTPSRRPSAFLHISSLSAIGLTAVQTAWLLGTAAHTP